MVTKQENKSGAMKLLILINNPARASFRQRIVVYLNIVCDNGIDCMVGFLD